MQDAFTLDPKQGGSGLGKGVLELVIKDPCYLKLATKFGIPLYESSELNRLTCTFKI